MDMDFEKIREKTREVDKSRLAIVSILNSIEASNLFGEALTQTQIDGLKDSLKSRADTLKTLAGGVKDLVA